MFNLINKVMRTLAVNIVTENKTFSVEVKKISDKKYHEIITSDSDEISKEMIQNERVIDLYRISGIEFPNNLIFDISYDEDKIVLIDEISTRDMLG